VPFVGAGQVAPASPRTVVEQEALAGGDQPHCARCWLSIWRISINRAPGGQTGWVTRAVSGEGFYYAPDPPSQVVCSIGANVARTRGGVHCLQYGRVTSNPVLELEVGLCPNGQITRLGGRWREIGRNWICVVCSSAAKATLGHCHAPSPLRLLPNADREVLLAISSADGGRR